MADNTYRDLGGGLYEVQTGGRTMKMRMDPLALQSAGFRELPAAPPIVAPPLPEVAAPDEPVQELTLTPGGFAGAPPPPMTPAAPPSVSADVRALAGQMEPQAPVTAPEEKSFQEMAGVRQTPTETLRAEVKKAGPVNAGVPPSEKDMPRYRAPGAPPAAAADPGGGGRLPFMVPTGGQGPARPKGLVEKQREVEGTEFDPEAMGQFAHWRIQRAEEESRGYAAMAEEYMAVSQRLAQEAQAQDSVGLQRRAKINEALANWYKDAEAVNAMKVDPNKYWKDRGVLGGILGAIAMGVGTYASTIAHRGDNPALSIIEAGIDREIDAQKANIQARQHGLQTQMTLLDRYMQSSDPEVAETLARATLKESVAAQLKARESLAMADTVQASARSDLSKLILESSETKVKRTMAQPQMTGGGGVAGGYSLQTLVDATGYTPQEALTLAQTNPKMARELVSKFLEKRAETKGGAEGKGAAAGGGMSAPVRGYVITDPRMHRMAVGFDAAEASAEAVQKQLLQELEKFQKATLGSDERQESRQKIQTLYQKVIEANGKVDVGVSAFGASQALREYLVPQIAKELGPNPAESEASNIASNLNPFQQSNIERLKTGLHASMKANKDMVDKRLRAYAQGGHAPGDTGLDLAEQFGVGEHFGLGEER